MRSRDGELGVFWWWEGDGFCWGLRERRRKEETAGDNDWRFSARKGFRGGRGFDGVNG